MTDLRKELAQLIWAAEMPNVAASAPDGMGAGYLTIADTLLPIIAREVEAARADEREKCAVALEARASFLENNARSGLGLMFANQSAAELCNQAAAIRART